MTIAKLYSEGGGMPEIKIGKVVAGDPATLDVLELPDRISSPELGTSALKGA